MDNDIVENFIKLKVLDGQVPGRVAKTFTGIYDIAEVWEKIALQILGWTTWGAAPDPGISGPMMGER